jgi:GWxTD domain-containing protein
MVSPATRLLREARAFSAVSLVAALAVVSSSTPAGAAREDLGPLPWRVGGHVGFTVDAAAFPDSTGGQRLEVYVRVPPSTLADLGRDASGTAHLTLRAQLKSGFGSRQAEVNQDFTLSPDDTLAGFGKVILVPFAARPGTQRLKVRLEDRASRKPGLVYAGRDAREHSDVDGEFAMSPAVDGRVLSDLLFIWAEGPGDSTSAFRRDGRMVIPNPERLYGLFQRELRLAFFAQSKDPARAWRWTARVLDAQGKVVSQRDSVGPAAARLDARATFGITREVAGGYDLEVKVWQEGDTKPLQRKARFSVAWMPESWMQSASETQDLVHFLLGADDEERFATLHPGEQERLLDDFWRRRDPTPDTPENENRESFLQRVGVANERFGRPALVRGMFTDMGRVYVRYGEPSETLRQVIPTGDNTLVAVLHDLALEEDRPLGSIQQKGPGGDMRPFEVWVYDGDIPLPPDADPRIERNVRRKRLVFLFVDEHGLGDYRLRYSNE